MADITCTAYCNSNAPIVKFLHHLEFPNRFMPTFQLVFVCPFHPHFDLFVNLQIDFLFMFRFDSIKYSMRLACGCVHSFRSLMSWHCCCSLTRFHIGWLVNTIDVLGVRTLLFHCNQCCLPPPSSSSSSLLLSFSLSHVIFVIRSPHGSLSLYLFSASYFLILSWINVKITRQKYTEIHQTSQWYK